MQRAKLLAKENCQDDVWRTEAQQRMAKGRAEKCGAKTEWIEMKPVAPGRSYPTLVIWFSNGLIRRSVWVVVGMPRYNHGTDEGWYQHCNVLLIEHENNAISQLATFWDNLLSQTFNNFPLPMTCSSNLPLPIQRRALLSNCAYPALGFTIVLSFFLSFEHVMLPVPSSDIFN